VINVQKGGSGSGSAAARRRCGQQRAVAGKRATLSEARKILRQACHILTELGDDALSAA